MNNLVCVSATALSAWASYLMNGCEEGMTPQDIEQADAFVQYLGGAPVTCEDVGFCWQHDARQFGALAGTCERYTALVRGAA